MLEARAEVAGAEAAGVEVAGAEIVIAGTDIVIGTRVEVAGEVAGAEVAGVEVAGAEVAGAASEGGAVAAFEELAALEEASPVRLLLDDPCLGSRGGVSEPAGGSPPVFCPS